MRAIRCVVIEMTTHCNMRCADCSAGVGINRVLRHSAWDEFQRMAADLRGVERIHIAGGEPTVHPQFGEYVPMFRALFGCRELTLSTNGARAQRYEDVLATLDGIQATRYDDNHEAVEWLLRRFPETVTVWDADHTPRSRRGSGRPCFRGESDTVAYADGQLFPCCVGPGIDGAQSMTPTANWKRDILDVPLPCDRCWFSP